MTQYMFGMLWLTAESVQRQSSDAQSSWLGFLPVLVVIAVLVVVVIPYGRIFKRTGYSPWLSLLTIIPLVNVAVIWWFSLAQWPAFSHRNGGVDGPKRGVIYTESEREQFRQRGFTA